MNGQQQVKGQRLKVKETAGSSSQLRIGSQLEVQA